MAVLETIKKSLSREGKSPGPLNTAWIMDKMNLSQATDEKQLAPLPLIGHKPVRTQMGLLLALMIAQNGALSRATDPWLASWLAHGVGSLVAGLLWWLSPRPPTPEAAPPWAWLGGLPGALTVVLAALCLNSPLGMAGTLALLLLGQLLFGALCDGRRPAYRAALGDTP